MRNRSLLSLATTLVPTSLCLSLMLTPMESRAGETSRNKSALKSSTMQKISGTSTSNMSSSKAMRSSTTNSGSRMMNKSTSLSNLNRMSQTGSSSNQSMSSISNLNKGNKIRRIDSGSTLGTKTNISTGTGNLKGSAPWLKGGSLTGAGKATGITGTDLKKTGGISIGTGLPKPPGGPIPVPYPNRGGVGKGLPPILTGGTEGGSSTAPGLDVSQIGKPMNPDLIGKIKIGDLPGASLGDSTPPEASPEPAPSDGTDPAPGSDPTPGTDPAPGTGSDPDPAPGSGGGSGGGSDPVADPSDPSGPPAEDHHDSHHHHDCYWDIHIMQPYFHTHCWHPTEACYVVWVYRSGTWVNEKVTDLAPLSTEIPLEFIAVTEPIPYEYDETLADGTVVHKSGVWWMGADEKPHGQENWSATVLGPEMASAFKALPSQP